jgi:hypothetical protein
MDKRSRGYFGSRPRPKNKLSGAQSGQWRKFKRRRGYSRATGSSEKGEEKADVASVDCCVPGMDAPVIVMQRYVTRAATRHFRLRGPIEVVINGRVMSEVAATAAIQVVR